MDSNRLPHRPSYVENGVTLPTRLAPIAGKVAEVLQGSTSILEDGHEDPSGPRMAPDAKTRG